MFSLFFFSYRGVSASPLLRVSVLTSCARRLSSVVCGTKEASLSGSNEEWGL